ELGGITRLRVVAHLQTGATDCKTLIVKQCADLANRQHILSLIITAITTPLNRLQLGKLLFPITQHLRLYSAYLTDFPNGKVALAGNNRQFVVMTWFQHMLLLWP